MKGPAEGGRPKEGGSVLVTGFDAFGGESVNPSWDICERLPKKIAGQRVETCRVPCEFGRAVETVAKAIDRHRPALVILLGQAGGRAHLSVERVAINVTDARIADNGGNQPIDEPIAPDGPPAYFATLPIKAMVAAMRAVGVPAEVSNSAGTYVCNHLMYGVLHYVDSRFRGNDKKRGGNDKNDIRAGFIHVPYSEEQVIDKPAIAGMSVATMLKGVEAAIAAAQRHAVDVKVEGGALD
jgi:pyroglutamyl-peptidase